MVYRGNGEKPHQRKASFLRNLFFIKGGFMVSLPHRFTAALFGLLHSLANASSGYLEGHYDNHGNYVPAGYSSAPEFNIIPFQAWAPADLQVIVKERLKKLSVQPERKISAIVIHHTADHLDLTQRNECAPEDEACLRAIDERLCLEAAVKDLRYHVVIKEWDSVGYNFLYCPLTRQFFGGREWKMAIPAAVKGHNAVTVSFANIGQFSPVEKSVCELGGLNDFPEHGVEDNAKMAAWLAHEYGVALTEESVEDRIKYHGQYGPTECPGQRIIDVFPNIRASALHFYQNTLSRGLDQI